LAPSALLDDQVDHAQEDAGRRPLAAVDPAAHLLGRHLQIRAQLLRAAENPGGALQGLAVDAPHRGTMEPRALHVYRPRL